MEVLEKKLTPKQISENIEKVCSDYLEFKEKTKRISDSLQKEIDVLVKKRKEFIKSDNKKAEDLKAKRCRELGLKINYINKILKTD